MHYRLTGDEVVRLLYALGVVGETHSAKVGRARKGLVTVLDVRPSEEYAAGHVPGAIKIGPWSPSLCLAVERML